MISQEAFITKSNLNFQMSITIPLSPEIRKGKKKGNAQLHFSLLAMCQVSAIRFKENFRRIYFHLTL